MRSSRARSGFPAAAREAVQQYADLARLSRELVTIRRDVPLPLDLDRLRVRPPDVARLAELFTELEFRSLIPKLSSLEPAPAGSVAPVAQPAGVGTGAPSLATLTAAHVEPSIVDDPAMLPAAIANGVGPLSSPSTRRPRRSIRCAPSSSAFPGGRAGTVVVPPLRARGARRRARRGESAAESTAAHERAAGAVAAASERSARAEGRAQHQVRLDGAAPSRGGARGRVVRLDAGELRARPRATLTRPRRPGARAAVPRGATYAELVGRGRAERPFAAVPLADAARYCATDSEIVLRLHAAFLPELEDHQLVRLLETIEMPLMPVLVDMESRGVCIDLARLAEISRTFAGELTALERAIYQAAGTDFNINSTPQLRHVLFEKHQLPISQED